MATIANVSANITRSSCEWILIYEVGGKVRLWDILMLVPSGLFLAFLLLKFRFAHRRLKSMRSPIFSTFFGMVMMVACASVARCVVSMTVSSSGVGYIADKILWLIVRFLLLVVELSVITFGLAFGHLDSRESIKRVLIVTALISLAFSTTQGVFEFLYHSTYDVNIHVGKKYPFFAHGGMDFWFGYSSFFFAAYLFIFLLPYTSASQRWALPSKKSFYVYVMSLSMLNLVQSIGCCLLLNNLYQGLCVVDVTSFLYFSGYAPLVYITFLKDCFSLRRPTATYDDPGVIVGDSSTNTYSSLKDEVVFPNNSSKWYSNENSDQDPIIVQSKPFQADQDDCNSVMV
ncbi:Transmembrane protein adipocyte-associated 1-like protein [Trichoplax sp. H2]|nr:Transmembrane protein adipocyte-associated 1-like protein [Trichoplax sp. H2]|eukprot:RDD43811.1 Transmembrane protein adipocyte-associated 1-like protein [Trichoplax sp. H2]